ncbi:hypothetical protein BH24ACT26_BH24ACT26_13440 [soil metagenome]
MSHRATQPSQGGPDRPSDDAASGEWDEDASTGLRIRWGRILILLLVLSLSFVAGRSSAPGGIPEAELREARTDLDRARARIEALETQAAQEPAATPTETPAEDPEGEGPGPRAQETPSDETYVVKSGDTLQTIAQQFYEDPTLDEVIAEANDITDPSQLSIGRELLIPDRPEL